MPRKDKQKDKEYQRKWRAENKEKCRAYCKAWREKYPDRYKDSYTKWRLEHHEESKQQSRKHYQNNREKEIARNKKYRLENPEKFREQAKKYRIKNQDHYNELRRDYIKKNKEKANLWNRNARRQRKVDVIFHYSNGKNECLYCKKKGVEFLTIDHIDGGGNEHRRREKIDGGSDIAAWLKRNHYPEGFQILCFNCNCVKAHFGLNRLKELLREEGHDIPTIPDYGK